MMRQVGRFLFESKPATAAGAKVLSPIRDKGASGAHNVALGIKRSIPNCEAWSSSSSQQNGFPSVAPSACSSTRRWCRFHRRSSAAHSSCQATEYIPAFMTGYLATPEFHQGAGECDRGQGHG
eukprot:CAMPEP_0117586692 /NCGR_PEP_ID=MMETSP0784-20121206/68862_1 /TAXON_ID=39447 /ORGANISM="" /LENGTH=122 /DNA_ID=CAMNT_0005387819 /DNA_START=172 /DNA_END=538 /DNA_ORIENTATION=+